MNTTRSSRSRSSSRLYYFTATAAVLLLTGITPAVAAVAAVIAVDAVDTSSSSNNAADSSSYLRHTTPQDYYNNRELDETTTNDQTETGTGTSDETDTTTTTISGNVYDDDVAVYNDNMKGKGSVGDLWQLSEPKMTYSESFYMKDEGSKTFRIRFTVSDIIDSTMFSATWWTKECPSAGAKNIGTTGLGYRFLYESDGLPPGDGSGTKIYDVAFEGAPTVLAGNTDIYREFYSDGGAKYGSAEVCVRVSLTTPTGLEVNFAEHVIAIQYFFSDGFFVLDEFNVSKPKAKITSIDLGTIMRAYDCSAKVAGDIKSQGMTLKICVEPVQAAVVKGYTMRSIDNFRYEKFSDADPTKAPYVQHSIMPGGIQASNGLSNLICERAALDCSIETMLSAKFYEEFGNVEGKGTAYMQLGTRTSDVMPGPDDDICTVLADGTVCSTRDGVVDNDGTCRDDVCQINSGRRTLDVTRRKLGLNPLPRTLQEEEFEELANEAQEIAVNMKLGTQQGINGNTAPQSSETGYHHVGATIGIAILAIFNIALVVMLVYQLPNFRDKSRLYL